MMLRVALLILVGGVAAADGTGTIRGTVRLVGPAPPPRLVEIAGDPACPRSMFVDDAVVGGVNGGVANVFVAVESLEIHPNWWDLQQGSRERPVEVTISGCRARPRAVGLMFGQPLFVANGDAVLHDLFLPATLQIWVP